MTILTENAGPGGAKAGEKPEIKDEVGGIRGKRRITGNRDGEGSTLAMNLSLLGGEGGTVPTQRMEDEAKNARRKED